MEVWDPKDETTVLSQIKSFIFDRTGLLMRWVVWLYPGNLIKKAKDGLCEEFYAICEHYGGAISNWAWRRRWNKNNKNKWKRD